MRPQSGEQIASCAHCGLPALTAQQFVTAAGQLGFSVDPVTGAASYATVSPLTSAHLGLPRTEAEKQFEYNVIEGRRGYVCLACGNIHCVSCLMRSSVSIVTGGPSCPSCDEGPHGLLER